MKNMCQTNNLRGKRRNPGSRPWIFKTQEKPWTFDHIVYTREYLYKIYGRFKAIITYWSEIDV
jgi:hypothetical protein